MQKFNSGDTVAINERAVELYPPHELLLGKVGIVYKYYGRASAWCWVFYPELPGEEAQEEPADSMCNLCYFVNEKHLELIHEKV